VASLGADKKPNFLDSSICLCTQYLCSRGTIWLIVRITNPPSFSFWSASASDSRATPVLRLTPTIFCILERQKLLCLASTVNALVVLTRRLQQANASQRGAAQRRGVGGLSPQRERTTLMAGGGRAPRQHMGSMKAALAVRGSSRCSSTRTRRWAGLHGRWRSELPGAPQRRLG
jgi:hypothetical protein